MEEDKNMIMCHLDDKEILSSEKMNHSKLDTTRKIWQTPKLTEIEYSKTNDAMGGIDDGGYVGS